MFKLNRKNGVSYYTITSFEETVLVKHGFPRARAASATAVTAV